MGFSSFKSVGSQVLVSKFKIPTLSPYKQLLQTKKPWGRYSAESVNGTMLPELGGNTSRDAVISNLTSGMSSGFGATASISYLNGISNSSSSITWIAGSIVPNITICSITRYTDSNGNIILGDKLQGSFIHGHYNKLRGISYIQQFNTPQSNVGNLTDWLVMCSTINPITIPNNVLIDGVASGIKSGGSIPATQLCINSFNYGAQSAFQFSQLLIFDVVLTSAEMVIVSDALKNYLFTGILDSPTSGASSVYIPTTSQFSTNNLTISGSTNTKLNGSYVSSSSSDQGANWFSWEAFNGARNDSIWISGSGAYSSTGTQISNKSTTISGTAYLGEWVQIKLPSAITLTSYALLGRIASQYTYPKVWYVAGSNDNSVWYIFDSQTTTTSSYWTNANSSITPITFPISTSSSYSYYRIIINSIYTAGADYCAVAQFNLIGL